MTTSSKGNATVVTITIHGRNSRATKTIVYCCSFVKRFKIVMHGRLTLLWMTECNEATSLFFIKCVEPKPFDFPAVQHTAGLVDRDKYVGLHRCKW